MLALGSVLAVPRADGVTLRIAGRIRLAREEAGLTQEQAAERLGLSGSGYNQWETGKRRVGVGELIRLSRVLARPVTYFIGEGDPDPDDVFLYEWNNLTDDDKETVRAIVRALREKRERFGQG